MNKQKYRLEITKLLTDPLIGKYTSQSIVQQLTHASLINLQQTMKVYPSFKITQFLRFFLKLLNPKPQQQIYVIYGLFKLFKDMCKNAKSAQINFTQISSLITDRIPKVNQQVKIKQKLLPLNLNISQQNKQKIIPPDVQGKIINDRQRLNQNVYRFDKRQHINRRIGQVQYSIKNNIYFMIDSPDSQLVILNQKFDIVKKLKTQLQMSKRDSVITHIAWSEAQQRIACLFGNFSISFWAKDDQFRFEVNVPIPTQNLPNPFIMIRYMQSSRRWFTLDNQPVIYVLSNYNFQPQYTFKHSKIHKKKQSQKMLIVQLKYRKLICLGFERCIFIISLDKKQLLTQITNMKTSVTSIAFSQSYQALFVSCYQSYFLSYQLSQFLDLTQKGKFDGHKSTISLLSVLNNKPVVISLQQSSIIKLWDIRDFQCFQTFSVLKNILYNQIISLPDSICLVGSKIYTYKWVKQTIYQQAQKLLLVALLSKQVLIVSNKSLKLHDQYTGGLTKIFKGIYGSIQIFIAYYIEQRNRLFLSDQQGNLLIYQTPDLTLLEKKKIQPRPIGFHFEPQLQLVTYCCLGNIYICEYISDSQIAVRRKILNPEAFISTIKISSQHDLIGVTYDRDPCLYFYLYQKGKAIGSLNITDFVGFEFVPGYELILILCKNQLFIVSYRKALSSISFFINKVISLWNSQQIQYLNLPLPKISLQSYKLLILLNHVVILSNKCSLYLTISVDFNIFKSQIISKQRQNYNPYRISTQNHIQAFLLTSPTIMIKDPVRNSIQTKLHHDKTRSLLKTAGKVGQFFYMFDDTLNIYLIQPPQKLVGCLNLIYTLPKIWNILIYTENDIKQMQFVLQFIQNEKQQQSSLLTEIVQTTIQRNFSNLTITNLLDQDRKRTQPFKQYRSCSLREKKMVLEKQRDDKQKMEDYIQHRKAQQQQKVKLDNRKSSQKQINQAINYFSINYNQALLKKGLPQVQIPPQIKRLQKKLTNSLMKDQKKSVVSKISKGSGGIYSNSIDSNAIHKLPSHHTNIAVKIKQILQIIQQPKRAFPSSKVFLTRLNQDLRDSKYKSRKNEGSLPSLKRYTQNNQ